MAQPVENVSTGTQLAEVDMVEQEVVCSHCRVVLDAETLSSGTMGAYKPICKSCKATNEMLRRHLGELPPQWNLLSADEQTDFFKKCQQVRSDAGGALRYKSVRAILSTQMSTKVIQQSSSTTGGSYRPLSWYEKQGYNTDDIEAKAPSQVCPIVGMTYMVPVVSREDGVIRKDIEETLLSCERDVKRRRMPEEIVPKAKKSKKGETQEVPQPIPLTDEQLALKDKLVDLTDLQSDSEDEAGFHSHLFMYSDTYIVLLLYIYILLYMQLYIYIYWLYFFILKYLSVCGLFLYIYM